MTMMRYFLIIISITFFSKDSIAQSNNSEETDFTEWKQYYNTTNSGIDSAHYVIARWKLGDLFNPAVLEVKYGNGGDSTTLDGNLIIIGKETEIIDLQPITITDTTADFFFVSNDGSVFRDKFSASYTEVDNVYVVLMNIKPLNSIDNDPGLKMTKRLLNNSNTKKDIKVRPHNAVIGNRG